MNQDDVGSTPTPAAKFMMKRKKIKVSDIELEANELGYKLSLEPKFKYAWIYGVPRGGIPAAFALSANMNHYGCRTVLVDSPQIADIIVDELIDSGKTKEEFEKKFPEIPFYALFTKTAKEKENKVWYVFPWEEK